LGGFTNGEITRAAGTNPTVYRQRLFLRHTWNGAGERENVSGGFNQLAGSAARDRVVLTMGNFSTLDVFDGNAYAKDVHTQFMNWGAWTYSAYDYAADARGFGWGATLEWYQQDWVARIGRMTGPQTPNALPVDFALAQHYGDQLEIEHAHQIGSHAGKVRVLAWRNRAKLASFADALTWLKANPGAYTTPIALTSVRNSEKIKYGVGINIEQEINDRVGFFLRAMKTDGRTETLAFTEVDGSFATGLNLQGKIWGRSDDRVGIAFMQNTLSSDRRRFLEAGGMSFFIGDGRMRYAPETIIESYYSLNFHRNAWVTADYQHIQNPAYNADRGVVHVFALRLHAEF
jgi:carbohydrate-selective porin OprB